MTTQARSSSDPDNKSIADVCRLYFIDELTKSEIADRLSISRFKVADLIKLGRERGVVRIDIADPTRATRELEERMAEKFSLTQVAVCGPSPATDLGAVGSIAADLLLGELTDGSILGLGWGSSVFHVVRALQTRQNLPNVDVIQLAGGVDGVELSLNAIALASAASQAFNGHLYSLHAPAFVDNAVIAEALRQEASSRRTFQNFTLTDCAVVGIGGWKGGSSSLRRSAAISKDAARHLKSADVSADVLMHFTNSKGEIIAGGPIAVGPTVEEFLQIPMRLAVAAGSDKRDAILSALSSGLITALATDTATATDLLNPRR